MVILLTLYMIIAVCMGIVMSTIYSSLRVLKESGMFILACSVFWILFLPIMCVWFLCFPNGKKTLKEYCEGIEENL